MDYYRMREEIIGIIAGIAVNRDLSYIDDNVKLRAQLCLDSRDYENVVMKLKKRYKVRIPEKDYRKLATIRTCIEYLTLRS